MNKLFCVVLFFSLVAAQAPGISFSASLDDLSNFLNREAGIPVTRIFALPNYSLFLPQSGDQPPIPLFAFEGMTLTRASWAKIFFTSPSPDVLAVAIGPIRGTITGNITIGIETEPITLRMSKIMVSASVKMGQDPVTRKPSFKLETFNLKLDNKSFDFSNPAINKFIPQIVDLLNQKFVDNVVIDNVNKIISEAIAAQDFKIKVPILGFVIDLNLFNAPTIVNKRLTVNMDGTSYSSRRNQTTCPPFKALPESTTRHSIEANINVDMFNCLLQSGVDLINGGFINEIHPFGINLTVAMGPNSTLGFQKDGLRTRLNTTVNLGQSNTQGDSASVELDLDIVAGINLNVWRHDLSGITVNLTLVEESLNFNATDFHGDERYNPTKQNFRAISALLNSYVLKFLPLNVPKTVLDYPLPLPSDFADSAGVSFNFGIEESGIFAIVDL